jgi:hypothetical protein
MSQGRMASTPARTTHQVLTPSLGCAPNLIQVRKPNNVSGTDVVYATADCARALARILLAAFRSFVLVTP